MPLIDPFDEPVNKAPEVVDLIDPFDDPAPIVPDVDKIPSTPPQPTVVAPVSGVPDPAPVAPPVATPAPALPPEAPRELVDPFDEPAALPVATPALAEEEPPPAPAADAEPALATVTDTPRELVDPFDDKPLGAKDRTPPRLTLEKLTDKFIRDPFSGKVNAAEERRKEERALREKHMASLLAPDPNNLYGVTKAGEVVDRKGDLVNTTDGKPAEFRERQTKIRPGQGGVRAAPTIVQDKDGVWRTLKGRVVPTDVLRTDFGVIPPATFGIGISNKQGKALQLQDLQDWNNKMRAHLESGVEPGVAYKLDKISRRMGELLPFSPDKMALIIDMNRLAEKDRNGIALTPEEELKLENYALDEQIQRELGATIMGGVTEGVAAMIPYAAEFAITSGLTGAMRTGISRGATRLFGAIGRRKMLPRMLTTIAQGLSVGMARTTLNPQAFTADMLERMTPSIELTKGDGNILKREYLNDQQGGWEAFWNTLGDRLAENVSEEAGAILMGRNAVTRKVLLKLGFMRKYAKKFPKATVPKFVKAMKKAGIGDPLDELSEERYNAGLREFMGIDQTEKEKKKPLTQKLRNIWWQDLEEAVTEALVLAVPTIPVAISKTKARFAAQREKKLKDAEKDPDAAPDIKPPTERAAKTIEEASDEAIIDKKIDDVIENQSTAKLAPPPIPVIEEPPLLTVEEEMQRLQDIEADPASVTLDEYNSRQPLPVEGIYDIDDPPLDPVPEPIAAVRTDDGTLYALAELDSQADLIDTLEIPPERIMEGGSIVNGEFIPGGTEAVNIAAQAQAEQKRQHRRSVETAVAEGREVAPEVLAAHPSLTMEATPDVTPEDVLARKTFDELALTETDQLDDAAFGFQGDEVIELDTANVTVKFDADMENAQHQQQRSGLAPEAWARTVDLTEPIEVVFENGRPHISDGHHRYLAARILGVPVKAKVEIKDNPIKVIAERTVKRRQPISASLVETFDIKLPEEYEQRGDLFVVKGQEVAELPVVEEARQEPKKMLRREERKVTDEPRKQIPEESERPSAAAEERPGEGVSSHKDRARRSLADLKRSSRAEDARDGDPLEGVEVDEEFLESEEFEELTIRAGGYGVTVVPVKNYELNGAYFGDIVLVATDADYAPSIILDHEIFHDLVAHEDKDALALLDSIDESSEEVQDYMEGYNAFAAASKQQLRPITAREAAEEIAADFYAGIHEFASSKTGALTSALGAFTDIDAATAATEALDAKLLERRAEALSKSTSERSYTMKASVRSTALELADSMKLSKQLLPVPDIKGRLRRIASRKKRKTTPRHVNKPRVIKVGKSLYPVGKVGPAAWKRMVETTLTDAEIAQARTWYADVLPAFRDTFGEDGPRMMLSWLLSQKAEGPTKGLFNVLRAAEDMKSGVSRGKKAGLSHDQIHSVLKGQPVTSGVGTKLFDFVDSAHGKAQRTVAGNAPEAGEPFVVDRWTWRDYGLIDGPTLTRLQNLAPGRSTSTLKADAEGTKVIKEAEYEEVADWGRSLTKALNKTNFKGGNWTAAETQAVGWVARQAVLGVEPGTTDAAMSPFTATVAAEVIFSPDSPYAEQFPRLEEMSENQRLQVTETVLPATVRVAAGIAGTRVAAGNTAVGGWMGSVSPNGTYNIIGTLERVESTMDIIGYLLQQDSVFAVTPDNKGTQSFARIALRDNSDITDAQASAIYKSLHGRGPSWRSNLSSVAREKLPSSISGKEFINLLNAWEKEGLISREDADNDVMREWARDQDKESEENKPISKDAIVEKIDMINNYVGFLLAPRMGSNPRSVVIGFEFGLDKLQSIVEAVNKDVSRASGKTLVDTFVHSSKTAFTSNNWKENSDGTVYLSRINSRLGSDIQSRVSGGIRKQQERRIAAAIRKVGPPRASVRRAAQRRSDKGGTAGRGRAQRSIAAAMKSGEPVQLQHWSFKSPDILRPKFHGTGIRGAEGQRKESFPKHYIPRLYFGGNSYVKEAGLGPNKFELEIDPGMLYDFNSDPKGLYAKAEEVAKKKEGWATSDLVLTIYEKLISQEGFVGAFVSNGDYDVAFLFEDVVPGTRITGRDSKGVLSTEGLTGKSGRSVQRGVRAGTEAGHTKRRAPDRARASVRQLARESAISEPISEEEGVAYLESVDVTDPESAKKLMADWADVADTSSDPYLEAPLVQLDPGGLAAEFEASNVISSVMREFLAGGIPEFDIRGYVIRSPQDLAALLMPLRSPLFESMKVVYLDKEGKVLASRVTTVGIKDSSLVDTTGLIDGMPENTAGVMLAHNHPSGDPSPSAEDVRITRASKKVFELVGVPVVDHVITNGGKFTSMRADGLIDFGESPVVAKHTTTKGEKKIPAMQKTAPWEAVDRSKLKKIQGPADLLAVVSALRQSQKTGSVGHVVYMTAKHTMTAVERFPLSLSPRDVHALILRGAAREAASAICLDVPYEPEAATKTMVEMAMVELLASGVRIVDAASATEDSLRNSGIIDFKKFYDARASLRRAVAQNDMTTPDQVPDSEAAPPPIWRSQLYDTVADKLPNSVTGGQLAATLQSWSSKGFIKKSELDDTAIIPWAKKQQGKLSKADVLSQIEQSTVEIKEVVKGSDVSSQISNELSMYIGDNLIETIQPQTPSDWSDLADSLMDKGQVSQAEGDHFEAQKLFRMSEEATRFAEGVQSGTTKGETKYSEYQLPGGKNYRELLLTIPVKIQRDNAEVVEDSGKFFVVDTTMSVELQRQLIQEVMAVGDGSNMGPFDTQREAWQSLMKQRARGEQNYTSGHWDELDVVVHIRFNERTAPDGSRILFIEEIQSDWHQDGRRKGYRGAVTKDEAVTLGYSVYQAESNLGNNAYFMNGPSNRRDIPASGWNTEAEAWDAVLRFIDEKGNKVPDAPFKKNWHELAMKRAFRWAVDNGFDTVAWTTGEQQADRYDLSKQVSSVFVRRVGPDAYDMTVTGKSGDTIYDSRVSSTAEEMTRLIGKDLTDKAIADLASEGDETTYSGLDLKVGGEGMVGFYDKMLPAFVNKYVKKWGGKVGEEALRRAIGEIIPAAQVGGASIVAPEAKWAFVADRHPQKYFKTKSEADAWLFNQSVHSVAITPKMKQAIKTEPQPRASIRRTTPNAGDRFPSDFKLPRPASVKKAIEDATRTSTPPEALAAREIRVKVEEGDRALKEAKLAEIIAENTRQAELDAGAVEAMPEEPPEISPDIPFSKMTKEQKQTHQVQKNLKTLKFYEDLASDASQTMPGAFKDRINDALRKKNLDRATVAGVNASINNGSLKLRDLTNAARTVRIITREARSFRKGAKETGRQLRTESAIKNKVARLVRTIQFFERLARPNSKSMPQRYKDQINALMARFDLHKRTPETLKRRITQREFVARLIEEGEVIPISPERLGELDSITLNDLTLEDLELIRDQIKMIAHLGRNTTKLLARKEKRDLAATVQRVFSRIASFGRVSTEADPVFNPPSSRKKGKIGETIQFFTDYFGHLRKNEFITDFLGPEVWGSIHKPIQDAADAEARMMEKATRRIKKEVFDPLEKEMHDILTKALPVPGANLDSPMTKEEAMGVALNAANPGNLARLKAEGLKLTDDQIEAIIAWLTPKEKRAVAAMHSIVDSLFEDAAKTSEKLTGIRPQRIEDGKYWPIHADTHLSTKAAEREAKKDLFSRVMERAYIERGFTISRVGGSDAVDLNVFKVMFAHIADVVHFSTHAVPVRDVGKIINSPLIRKALTETYSDSIYRIAFQDWLKDVAQPDRKVKDGMDKIVSRLRRNATSSILGVKLSVALVQPASITQTFFELNKTGNGYMDTIQALWEFGNHPVKAIEFVNEHSVQMRNRSKTFDREVKEWLETQEVQGMLSGKPGASDILYAMIRTMDAAATYPTWIAAYNQEMKRSGDPATATDFADKTVRKTQPAGSIKDLPGIMKGNEFRKLFTMFYTHFSNLYNQMAETKDFVKLSDASPSAKLQRLVSAWWLLMVLPPLYSEWARSGFRKMSVMKMVKGILSYGFGAFPFIRDLWSAASSPWGYRAPPGLKAIDDASRFGKEMLRPVFEDKPIRPLRAIKEGTKALGTFKGLPTEQAWNLIDGIMDQIADGKPSFRKTFFSRGQLREEDSGGSSTSRSRSR